MGYGVISRAIGALAVPPFGITLCSRILRGDAAPSGWTTFRSSVWMVSVNDMPGNLVRLKALLDPEGRAEHLDLSGDSLKDMYTEDVLLRWQGTDWPWGGDMQGHDQWLACMAATATIFSAPLDFWESTFWILDGERLLWWWRSRSTTFKGEPFSNSGLTILRYRDDKICEHWEYCDTQYLAEMFQGWRGLVDPEVGKKLASWDPPGDRLFPDSGTHR